MNKNTIISQGQFKYYVVDLPHNFSDSENVNFVLLLEYIGKQSIYERYGKTDIGRAYGIIRERTNNKLGLTRKDLILRTSKREVASIRRFFDPNIIRRQRYIKMPYKLEYIFSSIIFSLLFNLLILFFLLTNSILSNKLSEKSKNTYFNILRNLWVK